MLALPSFSKNSSGDGNPLLDYGMFCLFGLDKNKARSAGVPSLFRRGSSRRADMFYVWGMSLTRRHNLKEGVFCNRLIKIVYFAPPKSTSSSSTPAEALFLLSFVVSWEEHENVFPAAQKLAQIYKSRRGGEGLRCVKMLVVPIDPVNGRHYQIDYGRPQDLNTELASFLFGSKS